MIIVVLAQYNSVLEHLLKRFFGVDWFFNNSADPVENLQFLLCFRFLRQHKIINVAIVVVVDWPYVVVVAVVVVEELMNGVKRKYRTIYRQKRIDRICGAEKTDRHCHLYELCFPCQRVLLTLHCVSSIGFAFRFQSLVVSLVLSRLDYGNATF